MSREGMKIHIVLGVAVFLELSGYSLNFEAFTEVMFQVEVFRIVTPCSVVVGYQRFRGPCCVHLQGYDVV
jgi:hypothetical protein